MLLRMVNLETELNVDVPYESVRNQVLSQGKVLFQDLIAEQRKRWRRKDTKYLSPDDALDIIFIWNSKSVRPKMGSVSSSDVSTPVSYTHLTLPTIYSV